VPVRKPIFSFRKSEIPSTKSETMTKTGNVSMTETLCFQAVVFVIMEFEHFILFRISDFDIRILPERGFSFRHCPGIGEDFWRTRMQASGPAWGND